MLTSGRDFISVRATRLEKGRSSTCYGGGGNGMLGEGQSAVITWALTRFRPLVKRQRFLHVMKDSWHLSQKFTRLWNVSKPPSFPHKIDYKECLQAEGIFISVRATSDLRRGEIEFLLRGVGAMECEGEGQSSCDYLGINSVPSLVKGFARDERFVASVSSLPVNFLQWSFVQCLSLYVVALDTNPFGGTFRFGNL
ncbi:hypothetical protein CEXT_789371 [Caerostris extrusa]|uniref:Uncharacterized protein n=1 Tax=Caerostris extrusa TaxID=172846 RepID=A0AAV4XQ37_CAEEX|nr:hypothetical protein CEXT_789371 [Caerostris extrusa]